MTADFSRTLIDGSAAFAPLLEGIETYLEDNGVPQASTARLMVAFDEVISNILNHSGVEGASLRIDVRVGVRDGSVEADIRDNGIAFNPLELDGPDTSLPLDQRAIGGLGIHLVRELMDDVRHERRDGVNLLQLCLKFPAP